MAGTQGTEIKAVHREEWLDAGACRNEDPELFFPITSSGPSAGQIEAAKAVCQRCDVQDQCLHYALESHQNHGVWGGTSEEERRALSRRQRVSSRPLAGVRRPARPNLAHARPR